MVRAKAAKPSVNPAASSGAGMGGQGLSPGPGYSLRPRAVPGKGLAENC